jgi:AmmeMemoRadiSam system protein B/AmmeMemoRadiSam system protein A
MLRQFLILFIAVLFFPGKGLAQESGAAIERKAAFAGTFYPAQKTALESRLKELFRDAGKTLESGELTYPEANVQTIIVPHAGYDYSGTVAAAGYMKISKSASYKNIFIITTTHRQQFDGISVCQAGSYSTPLGKVHVNRQIAATLIKENSTLLYRPGAHEREQGIEVQLPFIQYHFNNVPSVIPIVMGSSSLESSRALATALLPWFSPENLFVISADFSRYPSYADAKRIDQTTADAVVSGNPEWFYSTLRELSQQEGSSLSTPSGDWSSLMTLLYMSYNGENLDFKPLLYRNSGDSPLGDRKRVVGYWAISGHQKTGEKKPGTLTEVEKNLLLSISRSTLESFIRNESIPELPGDNLTATLKQPATALVSLYLGDRLRGRIEYLTPAIPLSAMVQEMTIASATLDQRFAPVEATELGYITIEISLLSPLQKISSPDEIDPLIHGIYLLKDEHRGLYLPGKALEEQWSAEELLSHCSKEKAGLGWEDWKDADLYIFEAIRFSEADLNPSVSPAL